LRKLQGNYSVSEEHYLKTELYDRFKSDPDLFDFLQSSSLDGVWYWDLEHPENEWMSPRFWELFGYDPETKEHLASEWQHMIHPDDLKVAIENFEKHCANPSHPYDQIVRYKHRDGSTVWVRCRGIGIRDENGKVIRMLGAHNDLTEAMKLKDELERRTQDAEAANKAKSTFLANMSHEIRTPLNAIIGMAHIMRLQGLPASQAKHLDNIDKAGKHLLGVIDSILDMSKIEANKLFLKEEEFNIGDIVTEVTSVTSGLAHAKGLSMVTETSPYPNNLIGDATRLKQGLLNYVSNAVKHTDVGNITIRTCVEDGSEDTAHVRFEVQDTGEGIKTEDAKRLFSSFEQVDSTSTRKHGGTGLGLAITKSLAKLMGGDAGVDSTPGVGSTFWFSVRLKKAEVVDVNNIQPNGASTIELLSTIYRDYRILVVEDDPLNLEVIRTLLNHVIHHIDTASDGRHAVECASNINYDLILMDMQMPNMDGLEATRRIRQLPNGSVIPIIALTGNAFDDDKSKCIEAGMNDFLTKPVDMDVLYSTTLKWLSVKV
jgi:PAS domain S-box-containing protein